MTHPVSIDPIDVALGQRLRARRKSMSLSMTALAERAGMFTYQQLQHYEHGHNRIPASSLCKLAKALDTTASELLANL